MQDTKEGHTKQVLKTIFYFDFLAHYSGTNTQGKFRGCPVNRCFTVFVLDCNANYNVDVNSNPNYRKSLF